MRTSSISAFSILALGAIAAPSPGATTYPGEGQYPPPAGVCMTRAEALKVADNFAVLQYEAFNETLAREAVSKVFIDYNDSINTLINNGCPNGPKPLGSPTFATRKEYFQAARLQNPTPYETLKVWNTCDTVIARWRAVKPYEGVTGVEPQEDVTGIVVIEVVPNPDTTSDQPWQFATIYSEFNSFAWGYDLGIFYSDCQADGTPPPPPMPANTTAKRDASSAGVGRPAL